MSGSRSSTFKDEEIVFGMVTGYPWWPGFVSEKKSKKDYVVTFFGDFSFAPLSEKFIRKFKDGLSKVNQRNEELKQAVESARRVLKGECTIEEEHSKMLKEKRHNSKLKNKKIKKMVKKKMNKKSVMNTSLPEKRIRDQIKERKKKSKEKHMFKNKSMALEQSEEEKKELPAKILEEEDIKEVKSPKKIRKKSKKNSSPLKEDTKKKKIKEEQVKKIKEEKPIDIAIEEEQKEEKPINIAIEEEQEEKNKSAKVIEEKPLQEKKIEELEDISSIEQKKEEEEKAENEHLKKIEEKEIKKKNVLFAQYEESIESILNKMQKEESITKIEISLKDWMNELKQVESFSEIITTNIGKTLTEMRNICIERISDKEIYLSIFSEIEELKKLIMSRITENFFTRDFNLEDREEQTSQLFVQQMQTENIKKIQTPSFSHNNTPISSVIRKRIAKKIAKKISKIKCSIEINKNTAIKLGKVIETTIAESSFDENNYRLYVISFISMIDNNFQEFISKFILQEYNKCDLSILQTRVIQFLRSVQISPHPL